MVAPEGMTEEMPEQSSRSMHESARTDTCSNMTKDSGTEKEGLYGPWMVVSRKRNGYKGTKKVSNSEATSGAGWRPTRSHSLEGPNHVTKQSIQLLNNLSGPKEGVFPSSMGQQSLNGPQPKLDATKPLFGASQAQRVNLRDSVKGKKVIAQGRLSSHSPKSAADLQLDTVPLKLASIFNHGSEPLLSAPFKFVANAETKVGHQLERAGASIALLDTDPMQDESNRVVYQKEDARNDTDLHFNRGESSLHQVNPRLQTNFEVQSSLCSSGSRDGSPRTSTETQYWVRPVEGIGGEDRMEAEDGSGATPSC